MHKEKVSEYDEALPPFIDGMSEGTVRIVIRRHLGEEMLRSHGIKDLKNTGRYYIATLIAEDGSTVDELLVDKQCGAVSSLMKP